MITVQMNENEYKAYLLFRKSVKIMSETKGIAEDETIRNYLDDPDYLNELLAGIEDVKAGRITIIDPEQPWENIR